MGAKAGTIDPLAGVVLVLLAALAGAADADPVAVTTQELVSAPHDAQVELPAPQECGTQSVPRGDGTTVQVPRQGKFVESCVTVTVVNSAGAVLSTGRRCSPPVFQTC
jgi:hypothetical protein